MKFYKLKLENDMRKCLYSDGSRNFEMGVGWGDEAEQLKGGGGILTK